VVAAIRDMLSAADLPLGLEQERLLEQSLSLQQQLKATQAALGHQQAVPAHANSLKCMCCLWCPPSMLASDVIDIAPLHHAQNHSFGDLGSCSEVGHACIMSALALTMLSWNLNI